MARNKSNSGKRGSMIGSLTWIVIGFILFCGYLVYTGKWWLVAIFIIAGVIITGFGLFLFFQDKNQSQTQGTGGSTSGGTVRQTSNGPQWYEKEPFASIVKSLTWGIAFLMFLGMIHFTQLVMKDGLFNEGVKALIGDSKAQREARAERKAFVADSTKKAQDYLKWKQSEDERNAKLEKERIKQETIQNRDRLKHETEMERLKTVPTTPNPYYQGGGNNSYYQKPQKPEWDQGFEELPRRGVVVSENN
jgi:hypothetical protein